ncbi:hypothetical protein GGR56DRAFT_670153 [Xylariaceae sp. FL0804]|nr:hypothetical protein GGR56DRAFT_670153 [Xylariaceae sp. FL0804]
MPLLLSLLTGLAVAAAVADATFTLDQPPNAGYQEETIDWRPCGGFEVDEDNSTFADWPTGGRDVRLTEITDSTSRFIFRAALLSNPNTFVEVLPQVTSSRQGEVCLQRQRATVDMSWYGQMAIFQVEQYVGNGVHNYQVSKRA